MRAVDNPYDLRSTLYEVGEICCGEMGNHGSEAVVDADDDGGTTTPGNVPRELDPMSEVLDRQWMDATGRKSTRRGGRAACRWCSHFR